MKNNETKLNTIFTMDELEDIMHALRRTMDFYDQYDFQKVALRYRKLLIRFAAAAVELEEEEM